MVIISHIATTRTYESFFRHTFPAGNPDMGEQDFMKKMAKMPKVVMIQTIKQKLQQDSIDDPTTPGSIEPTTPTSNYESTV
jgi:hypothetical protein